MENKDFQFFFRSANLSWAKQYKGQHFEKVSCLLVMKLKQVIFCVSRIPFAFLQNRSQLIVELRKSIQTWMEPVFRIVMSIWLHAAFMFQITLFNGKSGEAISLCPAGCKSPNSYSSFRFEMKFVDHIWTRYQGFLRVIRYYYRAALLHAGIRILTW